MYKFCFRIFDLEDSEINYDRAHSTTVHSLLRAWRAICIISSDNEGKTLFFADEPLFISNGKLDTKWGSRHGKNKKETRGLLWMLILSHKHKISTLQYSLFTFALRENVLVKLTFFY